MMGRWFGNRSRMIFQAAMCALGTLLLVQPACGQTAPIDAPRLPQAANVVRSKPPALGTANHVTVPVRKQESPEDLEIRADGELISLTVREAPIKDVLAMIARTCGLNLVCSADGEKLVTLTLDRVTLSDALDALLSVAGYTWTWHNNIIHVTPLEGGAKLPPGIQGRQIAIFELDYASAVDVDLAVKGMLSPVGQSFIRESSPTNNRKTTETIIVEDLPIYLARIERYISQLDVPPRQVMIEVQILEVDLKDDARHGVNFEVLSQIADSELSIRTRGLANSLAPQAFFLELTGGDLTGLVEALKNTTDAKTLASPRILALNGQESRIQIGQQLGFRVTTTTETSTLESVEFIDVGVVVRVTPHITRDGQVLMRIRPEVSSGQVNPDTGLPEEETTEVETDVLLPDGQGIIIGGLIQEKDTNIQSKVPLLGDLHYVGALFQRRQVMKSRSEVIVALVPHVFPLNPCQQERVDSEVTRAHQPLVYGPLHRNPRPYEPRLPDTFRNPIPLWPQRAHRAAPASKVEYPVRLPQASASSQTEMPVTTKPGDFEDVEVLPLPPVDAR